MAYLQGAPLKHIRRLVPGFCPGWDRNYVQHHERVHSGFLFIIRGLHYPKLSGTALTHVFLTSTSPFMASGVRTVWSLHPAPGRQKPPNFVKSHGPKATAKWNRLIQQHVCRRPGDSVFDAFTPTVNATSIDGQHYYAEANLVVVQLLLNHIAGLL